MQSGKLLKVLVSGGAPKTDGAAAEAFDARSAAGIAVPQCTTWGSF